MTTILLPPEIERPLVEAASRLGTTPEQLAVETLRERFAPGQDESAREGEMLSDFLAEYVGVIDGSSEAYSERCGERFADGLIEPKRRASP